MTAAKTSIRSRLILAFALLLGLLLAVATVALERFDGLTTGIREFVDHQARLAFLAQRANQHAQDAALHLHRLLQTMDREQRVPLYLAMDAALAASDAAVGGLDRANVDGETRARIDRVSALRERYGELFQETVEKIEIEGLPAARTHFEAQTDIALRTLLNETVMLADHLRDKMQAEVEDLEKTTRQARVWVLLIAASALLAGGILAVLIARSIVRPIQEAVTVAETIACGDYEREVPPGKGREMGALLRSLDVMRDSIAIREDKILRLAYEDSLTGLANRTRFMEMLAAAVTEQQGALIKLNVDRFAPINHALGHEVGDRMLQEIALRLKSTDCQLVARLGGDEYAILLSDIDRSSVTAQAERILASLRQPLVLDNQRLDIDASLGIVFFPQDGTLPTVLLRRVDLAMNAAKRRHAGYAFGAEFVERETHEELSLIGEMRQALKCDEFVIFYQPKIELASRRIMGAEALLRWRHPTKGLVPPGRFIPFAEQTGFIREITPWLLRQAVGHAAGWHRDGLNIVASVNLSTLDLLNPELVDHVHALLTEAAVPPAMLCLEITESALMDDPEQALQHLQALAALGVKLSIDDYGSGQASLAYVKNLPVNELKIDRTFVDKVDSLPKNAAIVRSTILLCRELGLLVVAEGAETQAELDWLSDNACDVVQGYVIAKPMPQEDFTAWVGQHQLRG